MVAVDGKTARRSFDRQRGRRPLHLVSAWAVEQRLVLGQRRVDGDSNEIAALPELLALLALDGRIVTADAMHCQEGHGADHPGPRRRLRVWRSRATSRRCIEDVRLWLDDPATAPTTSARRSTATTAASRPAARAVVHDVAWLAERHDFPGLAGGRQGDRHARDRRQEHHRRHATTCSRQPLGAARFAEVVRTHWQIENRLHWVLDVVMDEDGSRARKDHAPENLARLRRFALNLLRANLDQGSTRGKIKRAGWDDAFLLKILTPPDAIAVLAAPLRAPVTIGKTCERPSTAQVAPGSGLKYLLELVGHVLEVVGVRPAARPCA